MSSFRCHQDVCWFCFEGSRASPIQNPVIRNTSWLEYQQKRSCRFLQKYTFSLLQVYNFFKLNIFFSDLQINYIFFFSKRSLGTNALLHSVEGLPFGLWAVSQPVHTAAHIQSDMLRESPLKLHFFSFFLSFIFFLFVFLFFDNWECWNLLRLRFITTQTCLILQKKGSRSSVYVGLG